MIAALRPCLNAPFAALALCACEPRDEGSLAEPAPPAEPAAPPAEPTAPAIAQDIVMEQTGWLTIAADGTVQTTYLDIGGTYRDYRGGDLVAKGTWRRGGDDALCFDPASIARSCWEIRPVDAIGNAIATDAGGKAIRITRIAYAASENPSEDGAN